jgi:PAS domain S-box-containing protein
MKLHRLKWLTGGLVLTFLFGFDYLRHFIFPDLLHYGPLYLASVIIVLLSIVLFNHVVFQTIDTMEQRLRQQNQHLVALNAVGVALSHSLDLDELLNSALHEIALATTVDTAAIYLRDGERVLAHSAPHLPEADADRISATLRSALAPSALPPGEAASTETFAPILAPHGLHIHSSTPLRTKDSLVGYLLLISRQAAGGPANDQWLLAAGAQIGIAIENSTLHGQVTQQAEYLRTVIQSSGSAILTIDLAGQITSWNRAAESIYGWSEREAVGQILPMVPPNLRAEASALMQRAISGQATIANVETQRLRKDGTLIPVMVTISPISSADGSISSVMGVSTNMTEQKQLERELLRQQRDLAVLAERERLARTLHDEVGQVLGYVNMQTQAVHELLISGNSDRAASQLTRMAAVVQEAHGDVRRHILDLHAEPQPQRPFLALLDDYLRRYRRYDDFTTELTVAGMDGLVLAPHAEVQLLHTVQEAITNTRRHARAQRVRISCVGADDQLVVTVADDGAGFDPAQVIPGQGGHFGLRIMRDRVEEIGGSLEVASQPGRGTTVTIRVPTESHEVSG